MTEVKHGQTKEKAGEIRLKHHLQHPLQCMSGAVVESFQLEPVGHVMTKGNCLLQEAINAAFAMMLDSTARGACYSCEKIGPFSSEFSWSSSESSGETYWASGEGCSEGLRFHSWR